LEDLRVEIRQEISRDIQGIVDSVADLKMALETSQRRDESSSGRGAGGAEAAAAVKQWAEDKLKAAEPSSEVEEQMQWQAAIVSDEAAEEELVWVGEKSTPTRDSPKKKAMNANVSREEAFANMQALLNSKPPPPPSEDGEVSSSATIDPDEEVWDPFVGAADAENVAKYEAELKEKIESSDTPNEIAENSEKGLTALRAGRDVARRAGNDVDMLEEGDELFAESIQFLELAVSGDSSSRAVGNLGNAHLARGRVQAVLAELALREAASARDARVNVGLDGTAEMYLELAEENLVQAGRYFRAAIVSAEAESEEMKVSPDGVASDTSGIKAKALTGWGTALSLRSELVLSSEGATMDAESLAVAAAEKFKAAAAIDRDSPKIYVSWGDALRLSASLGEVNDEEERLQQAKGCYGEALRLSPDYALALEALRDFDL
jgi:tetratricopeptide (TPR) repeat protein